MPIPTYVISLADETERRKHISRQLNSFQMPFEWLDACDMRQSSETLPPRAGKEKHAMCAAEIGCARSHDWAYQKIVERRQDYALIVEDDAKFIRNPHPLMQPENLAKIQQQYPFDVLIIGYVKTLQSQLPFYYRRIPIKFQAALTLENSEILHFGTPWQQYGCGTVAYIITQQGAQKMLAATQQADIRADNWLYFERTLGLKILHTRPTFVLEDLEKFVSSIRTENPDFLRWKTSSIIIRSIKGWCKHIWMNGLSRGQK